MKIRTVLFVAVALALAVAPMWAHHSNAAQFDTSKRTTMKGEITKIEWTNPHAYLYVSVKDASGKTTMWALEGFPPNTLLRTGWHLSDLKKGDVINFEGATARDGSPLILGREITLPDGRKLYWGPQQ